MPDEQPTHTPESPAPLDQGSAPETKNTHVAGGEVDPAQNRNQQPLPAGAKVEFFKLREERRNLKSENEALQARIEALENAAKEAVQRQQSTDTKVDPFTDHEKWGEQIERRAEERVLNRLAAEKAQRDVVVSAAEAEKWLLSQSHLKGNEQLQSEVARRIQAIYADAPGTSPKAAAKTAYLDMCEEMGLEPGISSKKSSEAVASTGFRPSAAGAAVPTKKLDAKSAMDRLRSLTPGSPEHLAALAEVRGAIKA